MVRMPPFLLGLTLLFWGWEVELLPLGAVGAVILELPRLTRWRWDFSEADMNRFWDLSYVLFLGVLVYSFLTTDIVHAMFRFLPWLPLTFFPFVAATLYNAEDCVRPSTFSLFLHRKKPGASAAKPVGWLVPYGYFVACFLGASVANARDVRFYAAVVVLGGWLLWTIRSRAAAVWMWAAMMVFVSIAGSGGHVGLAELQAWLESDADADEEMTQTRTAIGSMGQLKLSNRIILRVEASGRHSPPALLRRASFNIYDTSTRTATWHATSAQFGWLQSGPEPTTWFLTDRQPSSAVTFLMPLARSMGILPVPNGPCVIEDLTAGVVEINRCGSVRLRESLPLVRCTVKYCGTSTLDGPPTARDLVVPATELPAIAQIASELGLAGRPPGEIMRRLSVFFRDKFTYRTHLKTAAADSFGHATALNHFLLRDRAGHCEFFATATTLLLRQAQIPARYASGYAVPAKADANGEHLVRRRHAHAWVLVHMDGTWKDFDTTPAAWGGIEDSEASILQAISDWIALLQYRIARWRYYGDRAAIIDALLWVAPVPALWIAWRLFWKKRRVRLQASKPRGKTLRCSGGDSEFYLIEKHLVLAGLPRREGEPLREWLGRLDTARPTGTHIPPLTEIVALHYAYRFDPRGITAEQRRELKSRAEAWLRAATTS